MIALLELGLLTSNISLFFSCTSFFHTYTQRSFFTALSRTLSKAAVSVYPGGHHKQSTQHEAFLSQSVFLKYSVTLEHAQSRHTKTARREKMGGVPR